MEEKKSQAPQVEGEEITEFCEPPEVVAEDAEQMFSDEEEKTEESIKSESDKMEDSAEVSAEQSSVAESETAEFAETESAEDESIEDESIEDESTEEESIKEESTEEEITEEEATEEEATEEEAATEDAVEESFDEACKDASDPLEADETAEQIEDSVEESTLAPNEEPKPMDEVVENSESSKLNVGKVFTKWASAGFVVKSWQLAVAVAVVAAMVVGGVVLGVVLGNKKNSGFDDSLVDYEFVLPEGGTINEGQIVLPGYVELTFPARKQEIEIVLPNPQGNPCYFRYTLILEDTGEVLYQSRLIPPGKALEWIKLSRPLEKGDYALVIKIDSFALADGSTPMNGGEQKVLLKVR